MVAAGLLPYGWLVEQIGGEHVEAIALVKPGQSAELYQPTDAEVSRIMRAIAYFRVGMPFESGPWFEAIQSSRRIKVVDLRAGIRLRAVQRHVHRGDAAQAAESDDRGTDVSQAPRENDGSAAAKDPHLWLCPRLLKVQARTVAETLQGLDPDHASDYQRNLTGLEARLDETDRAIRKALAPLRGKAFFVFHPAWGYFAEEYGLRQVAIETDGKEPADRELTELQRQARDEGAKVIFSQPQFAAGAARAVARAIGGRVEVLDDLTPDVIAGLLETAKKLAQAYD